MLEKIKYENHKGQSIESAKEGVFVNSNDLRDYFWNYKEASGKIIGFSKGITKKGIPIVISAESDKKGVELKNRILELAEVDVVSNKRGKIIIGNSYIEGNIIESKKSNYLNRHRTMNNILTFVTDHPYWITEQDIKVKPISEVAAVSAETGLKKYPYTYPYRYPLLQTENNEYIDHYTDSDFKMIVYGPTTSVLINIAGHPYDVKYPLEAGEYMVIDSRPNTPREEKLYVVRTNGTKDNIFDYRSAEYSVFKKIPPGHVKIDYARTYGVEIIIYKERSEPPWKL